jgi:hypothetical protein
MQKSKVKSQMYFLVPKLFSFPSSCLGTAISAQALLGHHLVCENFLKNYFLKETCAIIKWARGFGFKNRNLGDLSGGRRPKNLFWIAVAKTAA